MNSSNSFNICPRCGNSNALNAKYCSRCGGQLKVPEEPIVCHKCHTHNSPMANFCRNCGTALKVGSETKICPRCGKEVSGDTAICQCGYSFVTYQQTLPFTEAVDSSELRESGGDSHSRAEEKAEKKKAEKNRKARSSKPRSNKGGRGWAIVGLIFVLLFAYLVAAPIHLYKGESVLATLRPEFLANLDKSYFVSDAQSVGMYGYDMIYTLVVLVKDIVSGSVGFGAAIGQQSIGFLILLVLTVVFALTALVHLIVCIVRICTGKRSKKANVYFLVMAILSTLAIGLILLFQLVSMPQGFLTTLAGWFALGEGLSLGYVVWAIPVYFWFFFFYSLGAKAKKVKESPATKAETETPVAG